MFVGRKNELKLLQNEFDSDSKSIILIYGKRRIGKSTLICHCAKNFSGIVINHQCIKSSFIGNIEYLSKSVCSALGLPDISFKQIDDIFEFLGKQSENYLLIMDEYQYLKASLKLGEMDSIMQKIVDRLPQNVKLVLCGSYISIMKELLVEGNPLFGRFTTIIHLKEMNYIEAAMFLPKYSNMDKIRAYAIFGGSPYVLSMIDDSVSIEENINKYLLPENSILSTYIENVILAEIKNTFDIRILVIIGNGKKKYSEILNVLNMPDNGSLDKQLNYLLQMETISKVYPINKKNDKKKSFYEINDNLLRFYFAMIFGNVGLISLLPEDLYYKLHIKPKINTFISLRFEEIVKQYFIKQAQKGELPGIRDIGTLWYDDSINKKNGQFDCVIEYESCYEIFEVKIYDKPMSDEECIKEIEQIGNIPGIGNVKIGFVCTAGFENKIDGIKYVELDEMFADCLKMECKRLFR